MEMEGRLEFRGRSREREDTLFSLHVLHLEDRIMSLPSPEMNEFKTEGLGFGWRVENERIWS